MWWHIGSVHVLHPILGITEGNVIFDNLIYYRHQLGTEGDTLHTLIQFKLLKTFLHYIAETLTLRRDFSNTAILKMSTKDICYEAVN